MYMKDKRLTYIINTFLVFVILPQALMIIKFLHNINCLVCIMDINLNVQIRY